MSKYQLLLAGIHPQTPTRASIPTRAGRADQNGHPAKVKTKGAAAERKKKSWPDILFF